MSASVKRIPEIDIIKGFAIFLVALGHGIIYFPIDLHEIVWCESLFRWLSAVHMPLFFLISGYCFSYHGNYLDHVGKKALRLVVPYIVFCLADLIPRALLSSLVNRPASPADSLRKIIFSGGELWFLYVLFEIFLIAPLIPSLIRRNRFFGWLLLAGTAALHFVSGIPSVFLLNRFCQYLFYFTGGYLLRQYAFKFAAAASWFRTHRRIAGAGALLLFAAWCYSHAHRLSVYRLPAVWEMFLAGLTLLLLAFCIQSTPVGHHISNWGMYSLQIYILNGFTLVASRTLAIKFLGITSPLAIILINLVVDLELAYLFVRYFLARFRLLRPLCGLS